LTLVDLEYETSFSVWEFEMLIVLKWHFCFHFCSLHEYINRKNETEIINETWDINFLWILVFPISSWHN